MLLRESQVILSIHLFIYFGTNMSENRYSWLKLNIIELELELEWFIFIVIGYNYI